MDPTSLMAAGVGFVGSAIAQKCADAFLTGAWARIVEVFKRLYGRAPAPQDLASGSPTLGDATLAASLQDEAAAVFGQTSALRRAQAVARVFQGASILWVDDQPANNAWEAALIRAFGARVTQVRSTDEALAFLACAPVDVILSDIARDTSARAGLEALPTLANAAPGSPVIFYVGAVRRELGTPVGAFGVTNRPDALLHLVLDVLERARM